MQCSVLVTGHDDGGECPEAGVVAGEEHRSMGVHYRYFEMSSIFRHGNVNVS
jgi:hypothetical protein